MRMSILHVETLRSKREPRYQNWSHIQVKADLLEGLFLCVGTKTKMAQRFNVNATDMCRNAVTQ